MEIELINFWKRCRFADPPYAHPDDRKILCSSEKYADCKAANFQEFIDSSRFGDFADNRLHLSLLPFPYTGDLANADIFILYPNPGFSLTDYYAEYRMPLFRQRLEMNLNQSFDGVDFPFLWLDPENCWHSGYNYWEKRLRRIVTMTAEKKFNGRYLKALRDLATRLALIELVPYHSESFEAYKLINVLPSVKEAMEFVDRTLIPATRAGVEKAKTVIVTRQAKAYGTLKPNDNLIIYLQRRRDTRSEPGTRHQWRKSDSQTVRNSDIKWFVLNERTFKASRPLQPI